ncbi:hypothetical protein BDR05DRAFT_943717 [Suillus weaverae]|nr:hypothetical protein BDR05DRAFT_943717 [Suillus weaverae]
MYFIDIPEDIRHLLGQQLPNNIKDHLEPHVLQYLLKQLESVNPTPDLNRRAEKLLYFKYASSKYKICCYNREKLNDFEGPFKQKLPKAAVEHYLAEEKKVVKEAVSARNPISVIQWTSYHPPTPESDILAEIAELASLSSGYIRSKDIPYAHLDREPYMLKPASYPIYIKGIGSDEDLTLSFGDLSQYEIALSRLSCNIFKLLYKEFIWDPLNFAASPVNKTNKVQ